MGLAGLLVPVVAYACLWVDGITVDGKYGHESGMLIRVLRNSLREGPADATVEMFSQLPDHAKDDPVVAKEIEAVTAVGEGKYDDGIAILLQIEKESPGRYSTASNLGTIYELKGENEAALKWISEGLIRNPNGHYGTEWLHKLILEAKVNIASDPKWLESHRVIELDESKLSDASYRFNYGSTAYSVKDLMDTLDFQLRERMVFVKPKDPIVADLLLTYSVLESHNGVVDVANELLDLSKLYGFADQTLIDARYNSYARANKQGEHDDFVDMIVFYAVAGAALLFVGLATARRIKNRRISLNSTSP